MHCPGSVRLTGRGEGGEANAPVYTREGTKAHRLAEAELNLALNKIWIDRYLEVLEEINPGGEMTEAVDQYVGYVLDCADEMGRDALVYVEKQVSLESMISGCYGTADAVLVGGGTVHVIDFKYGQGQEVEAEENPQLRLYGAGTVLSLKDPSVFKKIRLTVVQPRLGATKTETLSIEDLMEWVRKEAVPAARLAAGGDCERAPGKWCRYCKDEAVCRARAKQKIDQLQLNNTPDDLLQAEEMVRLLNASRELKNWIDNLEEVLKGKILEGEEVKGVKLVEGRGRRKYTDAEKAAEALSQAGYGDDVIYQERKLNGITELERTIGKEELNKAAGLYIRYCAGPLHVVSDEDDGPEKSDIQEGF